MYEAFKAQTATALMLPNNVHPAVAIDRTDPTTHQSIVDAN